MWLEHDYRNALLKTVFELYCITNKINGKIYIGQTHRGVSVRWSQHRTCAKRGDEWPICRAIRKYGEGSFTVEVLACALTQAGADESEKDLIAQYGSTNPQFGYNAQVGGVTSHRMKPMRGAEHPGYVRALTPELAGQLYVAGGTLVEIAERFGCSTTTVARRLLAAGVPTRQSQGITPEHVRKLSSQNAKKNYHKSLQNVEQKGTLPWDQSPNYNHTIPVMDVAREYADGAFVTELAEKYGTWANTICARLNQVGVYPTLPKEFNMSGWNLAW